MITALIDSDILIYRAAVLTEDEPPDRGVEVVHDMHAAWTDMAGCDTYLACLSVGSSFRRDVYPEYKTNRKDKPKPRHLQHIYDYVATLNSVSHPTWEADDVMGYLHTLARYSAFSTRIVTIDKDLDQVPGSHYNPDKGLLYDVSDDQAHLYKWIQVLTGDTTDGYPGIPGVGVGKASKLLADVSYGDRERLVEAVYKSRGLDGIYYNQMLSCATIITFDGTDNGLLAGY